MIYKDHPDLNLTLVEGILRNHFKENARTKQMRSSLKIFCQECSGSDKNMLRMCFRLVKKDLNYILIDSVINSLPADAQKYISLKYRENSSNVTLQEQETHVSRGQLNIWRKKILACIWRALNYELTIQDIYLPMKILNMIEVLATLLTVYNDLDPTHEIVDAYSVQCLEHYYNSYRRLYDELQACFLNQSDNQKMNLVVLTTIKYPYMKKEALANMCGINQGTFTRHQKCFEERVRPYVVEDL